MPNRFGYPISSNKSVRINEENICFFFGCSPSVEPEEPPVPPNIIETAERFFEPTGSLTQNNLTTINDWLLSDGGVALLGANAVLNNVLPNTLDSLNEGLGIEIGDTGSSQSTQIEDLGIEGDGWIRLTQPCGREKNDNIVLSTLFTNNGLILVFLVLPANVNIQIMIFNSVENLVFYFLWIFLMLTPLFGTEKKVELGCLLKAL